MTVLNALDNAAKRVDGHVRCQFEHNVGSACGQLGILGNNPTRHTADQKASQFLDVIEALLVMTHSVSPRWRVVKSARMVPEMGTFRK
jgi:hypothetical protein